MRICIELPWPPQELSPNGPQGLWRAKAKAKKRYRDACTIATLEAVTLPGGRRAAPPDGPLRVSLAFSPPPDGLRRDRDNLVARMKSGLDGVAMALQIDDVRFAEVSARIVEAAPAAGLARVSVTIDPDTARESAACRADQEPPGVTGPSMPRRGV